MSKKLLIHINSYESFWHSCESIRITILHALIGGVCLYCLSILPKSNVPEVQFLVCAILSFVVYKFVTDWDFNGHYIL